MPRAIDLIGLGESPLVARRLADDPISVQCGGASAGSALALPPFPCVAYINVSNSGSGLLLPAVGGDPGLYPGDQINVVNNLSAGSVAIYAANNALGSAVLLIGYGAATTGTTGVSLSPTHACYFQALTVSTYLFLKSSI